MVETMEIEAPQLRSIPNTQESKMWNYDEDIYTKKYYDPIHGYIELSQI
jgi:hypothetical protein